ncbi:hypothetical protein ACFX13_008884 [Malus domestica]
MVATIALMPRLMVAVELNPPSLLSKPIVYGISVSLGVKSSDKIPLFVHAFNGPVYYSASTSVTPYGRAVNLQALQQHIRVVSYLMAFLSHVEVSLHWRSGQFIGWLSAYPLGNGM